MTALTHVLTIAVYRLSNCVMVTSTNKHTMSECRYCTTLECFIILVKRTQLPSGIPFTYLRFIARNRLHTQVHGLSALSTLLVDRTKGINMHP